MTLAIDDFPAFHEAVHGQSPFDWQTRLLREVEAQHAWPRVIDLPTGAGKTTCIDIALFALALDSLRPAGQRWCARRIAMVVDRRVVVDQAAERGRLLASKLADAREGVLSRVADALRALSGGREEPLGVFTLRGGIPKDDGWARTPHQPLILASTVDQIGSRLLVQGYGVTRSMRPVHAGLLGCDTLLLLDEVHLSRPFAETLEALGQLRSAFPERAGVRRLQVALLSATPGALDHPPFQLAPEERSAETELGRRLRVSKPARIEKKPIARAALADACARAAEALLACHDVVAVVVNRVASARDAAKVLRERVGSDVDVALLTGRMRPLDRDDRLMQLRPRIAAGRDRAAVDRKLVVVSTQCIEAGADFDFDALVTESASLDALRQRFGRVDRLARYGKAAGVIVHVSDDDKDDPVYGSARYETFRWLKEKASGRAATVDFGIEKLPEPSDPAALATPKRQAPILLPAYMDLWMQTAPEPAVLPEVALFLHGPDTGPPDVQVVWRADLLDEHLAAGSEVAAAIVSAVRPSSLEAVSIPFATAKRWLAARPVGGDGADVEGLRDQDERRGNDRAEYSGGLLALRWRGNESEIIRAEDLRPGDTIVIPSLRGGLRDATFDPESQEPVPDLAERASLLARGRPALRVHPAVLAGLGLAIPDDEQDLRGWLGANEERTDVPWRRAWFRGLSAKLRRSVVTLEADRFDISRWLVLEAPRLSASDLRALLGAADTSAEAGADVTTDDEDSFHVGRAGVTLARHSADVEHFVRHYAERLGLPEWLCATLALAAWLHDIGKADPRFQLLLRGGDEIEWLKREALWAKSLMPAGDRQAHAAARERSGYPRGARHEVQSLAMIESARSVLEARAKTLGVDLDLALHLVASHHGHCRPFAPPVADEKPKMVSLPDHTSEVFGSVSFPPISSDNRLHRLDSSLADRFWALVEKYGWLELCWLEAVLRLADHRASEEEER